MVFKYIVSFGRWTMNDSSSGISSLSDWCRSDAHPQKSTGATIWDVTPKFRTPGCKVNYPKFETRVGQFYNGHAVVEWRWRKRGEAPSGNYHFHWNTPKTHSHTCASAPACKCSMRVQPVQGDSTSTLSNFSFIISNNIYLMTIIFSDFWYLCKLSKKCSVEIQNCIFQVNRYSDFLL